LRAVGKVLNVSLSVAIPFSLIGLLEARTPVVAQNFNKRVVDYSAMDAPSKDDLERALTLHKRAVEELRTRYDFKKSAELNSVAISVSNELKDIGDMYKGMGRYEDAEQSYNDADLEMRKYGSGIGPGTRFKVEAGRAYVQGKMYDMARKIFEPMVASDDVKDRVTGHLQLSQCYEAEGNSKMAIQELTDILAEKQLAKESPHSVYQVRNLLKKLYGRLNMIAQANAMETMLQDKHCPLCGSDKNVIPIKRGREPRPEPGEPPVEEAKYENGCVIESDPPRWFCKTDSLRF